MRRERPGHTLQPTALVHEVYLRLTDQEKTGWQDRRHFFAIASTLMRRVLVNHARDRKAAKRGGGAQQVPLADAEGASEGRKLDIIALDEALEKLEKRNPRACRIVEMRFFAGLTAEEAAEELGIDVRTAERDWTGAKAFLKHELCS
jgi:RNA polymerase sigma factor (TIGR02999 family)